MQYRRSQAKGATFFFTVVMNKRKKILCRDANAVLIKEAFHYVIKRHTFRIRAFVLMPENDNDFSMRWGLIKGYFSRRCEDKYKEHQSVSRLNKGEQGVWQRRFWEHQIRNEVDFTRHVEYIHYNPVKHGLVNSPNVWTYSSFHRYVKQGIYDSDWRVGTEIKFDEEIGYE
ncbi:MAG: transposase [Planctomycetes bacterium]|uniref:REP-associated tyrosine transposase n=1 Tax=Candidatus Wunengus sp. YC65 TaxID=3367701 RepID=UPI001DE2ABAE|nr:transposase [Planctomycetota bacterium]